MIKIKENIGTTDMPVFTFIKSHYYMRLFRPCTDIDRRTQTNSKYRAYAQRRAV